MTHISDSLPIAIGAAFTLPSSISLIVQSNPDPNKQAKALAAFAAAGAVGNVAGFVLVH